MPSKTRPFSLILSTTELGWLAGAFGVTRLALPIAVPPPAEDALRRAQESLAMRGLIRRDPGTGWQADRLAAFLVQWLGAGERYLRLDVDCQHGESSRAGLYARPELFLLADCRAEQIGFFFLPDEKSLAEKLAAFLDPSTMLRAGPSIRLRRAQPGGSGRRLGPVRRGEGEFTLPQPRELVRATWQDDGPARRALARAGLSKREAASTLTWVQSLKTVVTFSPIPPEGKELLLCGDGSSLWAGTLGKFVPCSWKDAVRQVLEML